MPFGILANFRLLNKFRGKQLEFVIESLSYSEISVASYILCYSWISKGYILEIYKKCGNGYKASYKLTRSLSARMEACILHIFLRLYFWQTSSVTSSWRKVHEYALTWVPILLSPGTSNSAMTRDNVFSCEMLQTFWPASVSDQVGLLRSSVYVSFAY